ncbi:MAG: methylenetetrahydromethanopterin dehydrogenase [Methylobacter sp.]|nr:methylenetetrahydromethanopterin dehydrogenase [Methylobacter sp.]MDP2097268.1 methylenetetrahydromethanopterin dehydrogenase [Methylobacter sp.]MDP2428442.1 methylenetetrahydromethanopterin dehydrogenase [Methylobacter sp.]MDP3053423.1 methylenetetrahydromethanopterin dehydrogenase [Methylobacter sp.]MDP3361621.1 methylenetetrahydromethanopterin dehydrogenase [Methylobacter sp.]
MAKRSILHMLDPMPNNSPFDINMALDAGFDVLVPYSNVKLDSVYGLTQDAIFSRSPSGVKRTGIFIGGRDLGLAMDMLNTSKQAMVPPFQVSVFADPSGAFTTAAALVTCAEKELKEKHGKELKQCSAVIFGGTGPVGIATGIIASLAGADVTLTDHLSADAAQDVAKAYNRRFNCSLKGAIAHSDADKAQLISDTDIIFCTAKAGIQVLSAAVLKEARQLKVAGDVNAVPPFGIEGVKNKDFGAPLIHATQAPGAVGIGSLAIGDVKFQLQHELLSVMQGPEQPLFIDFRYAFDKAREMQFGANEN